MSRRTAPQHKADDIAFPVRVKVRVPECGFGTLLAQIYTWLDREIGRGEYAHHSATAIGMDATAFYFRNPEAAAQFVSAFDLKLADGTGGLTYSSPAFPFGRGGGKTGPEEPDRAEGS